MENGLDRLINILFNRAGIIPSLYLKSTQWRFPPKYIVIVFQAIQSTLRSLEIHSKGRYKICTCSVILGELESSRNYKGFSIILQKILDAI